MASTEWESGTRTHTTTEAVRASDNGGMKRLRRVTSWTDSLFSVCCWLPSPASLLLPTPQTTIMAMTYDGGVVMGADSRTSTGSYVANRVSDKLTAVHERIYCCRSGSAADTQAVSDVVRYYLDVHAMEIGHAPLVKTAAALFQELCYNNKERLQASIICAGANTNQRRGMREQTRSANAPH